MRFNAGRRTLSDLAHIQKHVAQISLTCAIPHKYIYQNNTKYLGANVTIDPTMNLAAITERTAFDPDSSAFVLLELLAGGHAGKPFDELPDDELMRALDAACDRMKRLETYDQ
jgi:hypothetical protein